MLGGTLRDDAGQTRSARSRARLRELLPRQRLLRARRDALARARPTARGSYTRRRGAKLGRSSTPPHALRRGRAERRARRALARRARELRRETFDQLDLTLQHLLEVERVRVVKLVEQLC